MPSADCRGMKAETFKVLEQADLPARQACAIAHAVEIECAAGRDALATKTDLANMGAELVRWLFLVILGQTAVLAAGGYFYLSQLAR